MNIDRFKRDRHLPAAKNIQVEIKQPTSSDGMLISEKYQSIPRDKDYICHEVTLTGEELTELIRVAISKNPFGVQQLLTEFFSEQQDQLYAQQELVAELQHELKQLREDRVIA